MVDSLPLITGRRQEVLKSGFERLGVFNIISVIGHYATRHLSLYLGVNYPRIGATQELSIVKQPKLTHDPEEFFFETIKVAQASATSHEKAKLITTYPSQPWRSAVVTAFVTCPDNMAYEVAAAFNAAVDEVFARHSERVQDAKQN